MNDEEENISKLIADRTYRQKCLIRASVGDSTSTWCSGTLIRSDPSITTTKTIWTVDQTVDVEAE